MQITLYSCPILMKLEHSRPVFEEYSNEQNFIKMRPLRTDLFHADRGTDIHDKAITVSPPPPAILRKRPKTEEMCFNSR
jgi:hypothetical protein